MSTIRPRYEFRVWGEKLDDVAIRVRALSDLHQVRDSRETYLIVAGVDDVNPKVRAALLDIKILVGIERGFEQWDPWLKAEFPVAGSLLAGDLFPRLGIAPLDLDRDTYTLAQFMDEVVMPHPDIDAVEVSKHRETYSVSGCLAEVAEVVIGGESVRTVAIESTDLEALSKAIRRAGLGGYDNVSYPRAIKDILGRVS